MRITDISPILQGKKVVIVDDGLCVNRMLSHICRTYFKAQEVIALSSFQAAENITIRNGTIDLVVLDIQLNKDNDAGITLGKIIKRAHDTPILFINDEKITDEQQLEIDRMTNKAFEFKPITIEALYNAFKYLLVNFAR